MRNNSIQICNRENLECLVVSRLRSYTEYRVKVLDGSTDILLVGLYSKSKLSFKFYVTVTHFNHLSQLVMTKTEIEDWIFSGEGGVRI